MSANYFYGSVKEEQQMMIWLFRAKVILWSAILLFCGLCCLPALPIASPFWTTWICAVCALVSSVIDLIEQKKHTAGKLARQVMAFAGVIPLAALVLFRSGETAAVSLGCADWIVIVFLYLTLAVSTVQGFIAKED